FAIHGDSRQRLLLLHDRKTGDPFPKVSDEVVDYIRRHEPRLMARTDLHSTDRPWRVFRTGSIRPNYRVIWRDIATQLEAAVLEPGESAVPLNSCYYVEAADATEAYLVAAIANSTWARAFAASYAEPAMNGHYRFMAWVFGMLPWPKHLRPESRIARRLVGLARRAQATGTLTSPTRDEIDRLLAVAYGLEVSQQTVLRRLADELSGGAS
ncbi:MAG: hypothetical protein KC561_00375, partial [Myxococcales bacterium]|nr:hypothetical protein [Myxococcales bacterium]